MKKMLICGAMRKFITSIAVVLCATAQAQVVSVECCISSEDVGRIGECMSTPGDETTFEGCAPVTPCRIGFGDDTTLMSQLCDSMATPIDGPRGWCVSQDDRELTATTWCAAIANDGVSLATIFDHDGDGDMDLRDVADFMNSYRSAPKQVQSEASIAFVECCVPRERLKKIGDCLSGPAIDWVPQQGATTSGPLTVPSGECGTPATCTIGFTSPVELGDYLHELCEGNASPLPPDLNDAMCMSWQDPEATAVFECIGVVRGGMSPFVVFDEDGDGDLDLRDFSTYQVQFGQD